MQLQGHVEILQTICDEYEETEGLEEINHPDDLEGKSDVYFKLQIKNLELEDHNTAWDNDTYACL